MTTDTDTLTQFLEREIAADEVDGARHTECCNLLSDDVWKECDCGGDTRLLRQCAAFRAIVAEWQEADRFYAARTDAPAGELHGLTTALRALASIFADRPGFDPAWLAS